MTNIEIKEKFDKIKQNIENDVLFLEKYSDEKNFSEVYQNDKPKNLPKIIYKFCNNRVGRFSVDLTLYNFKGYRINIYVGTNFNVTRKERPKNDKRNRFREVTNEYGTLLLEKAFYHKKLYDLEFLIDYKKSYNIEEIISFFGLNNIEEFELILLKLVKELILKKDLKEMI